MLSEMQMTAESKLFKPAARKAASFVVLAQTALVT